MFSSPVRSNLLYLTIFAILICFAPSTVARDVVVRQSIEEAMKTLEAQSYTGVQFFFGDQRHGEIKKRFGSYDSRRTTNAFGKTDQESCQWAFLSGIKSLYQRALSEGGNAVINIQSITTGESVSSETEFVCRAGNVVSKVYLKGEVVLL